MKLPTGIETLDRKLGGGIPPGTLVAVTAPPGTQHDPLVCAGTGARQSLFYTTVKSEAAVHRMLESSPVNTDVDSVRELDSTEAPNVVGDALDTLDGDRDFYIDPIDPIEMDLSRTRYLDLLNAIADRVSAVETTGYLYCYRTDSDPDNRRYTLDIADLVLNVRVRHQRNKLRFVLEIPKANGLSLNQRDRFLEISLGPRVDVDETRNI